MKRIMKNNSVRRLAASAVLLLVCIPFMLAQGPLKVTGRIIDDLNEPMIGVSVFEKGTSNGVITDIDGNYALSVKEGAIIVLSLIHI